QPSWRSFAGFPVFPHRRAHVVLDRTAREGRERFLMKHWLISLVAAGTTVFCTASIVPARADRFDDIAGSPMSGGRPTAEASKSLTDELLFQRATQVYLLALPLINTLGCDAVQALSACPSE